MQRLRKICCIVSALLLASAAELAVAEEDERLVSAERLYREQGSAIALARFEQLAEVFAQSGPRRRARGGPRPRLDAAQPHRHRHDRSHQRHPHS